MRIEWGAKAERVKNSKEADKMLDYTYRSPWKA